MDQCRLGNKFISYANTYRLLESFHLQFFPLWQLTNTNYLAECCLSMAHVFQFIHDKSITIIEPVIHYGNKYMCLVQRMYVVVACLMSQCQSSSNKNCNSPSSFWVVVINPAKPSMIKQLHLSCFQK